MDIDVFFEPVFHIVIKNIFTSSQNLSILKEAIKNKHKFEDAVIGKGIDKKFRSNKVAYYDLIYNNNRNLSKLLSQIDKTYKNTKIIEPADTNNPS